MFFLLTTIGCLLFMSSYSLQNGGASVSAENDTEIQKIEWLSFEEAIAKNQEEPKKIFVDLYTDWCTWCARMEKSTFEHPAIAEYVNKNFYPVKLDAETKNNIVFKNNSYVYRPGEGSQGRGVHEIAIYLTRGRLNYPSVVFMDETMGNPQPVAGFQNPVRMDKLLKYFGENYYKQVDWGLFNQIYNSPIEQRAYNTEYSKTKTRKEKIQEQRQQNKNKNKKSNTTSTESEK